METNVLVTVVIPTYNRAHTLKRALDSVLAQDYENIEIILVDDGSNDGSEELVKKYPSVKYIKLSKRMGVSYARNRGIEAAAGEYISLLDSDDVFKKSKTSIQLSKMLNNNYLVTQTDEIWIRNGVRVNPKKKHIKKTLLHYEDLLPLCLVSPSALMIHKSVFDKVGLFDESLPACEDYDMWLRIRPLYPIYTLKEKLTVKYGGHADQLSRQFDAIDEFRVKALLKALKTNKLSEHEKKMTFLEIKKKCGILIKGYRKHNKPAIAEKYQELLNNLTSP